MRNGLLTARNLPAAGERLGRPVATVADVAELGARFGHRQVLVDRTAFAALRLPDELPDERAHPFVPPPGASSPAWRCTPDHLAPFLAATFKGTGVDVHLLPYDHAAGLEDRAGAEARDVLERYAKAVGLPYRWSPGYVGQQLMTVAAGGRGHELGVPGPYPSPALDGATEADLAWWRPLTLTERVQRFVHVFDSNGRYLAAVAGLDLGLGAPRDVDDAPPPGSSLPPGYWRVKVKAPGPDVPWLDPLGFAEAFDGHLWWSTPTLALARQYGWPHEVIAGHVWREHARWLNPWYERLREARRALILGGGVHDAAALAIVKRTYTIAIGYLAAYFHGPTDPLYRPDWRHHIVGRARANLARAVLKSGLRPFAIDVDAVYFTSDDPDPERAAGTLPVAPGRLGYFKHAGTFTTALASDALADERPLVALRRAAKASTMASADG